MTFITPRFRSETWLCVGTGTTVEGSERRRHNAKQEVDARCSKFLITATQNKRLV